MVNQNWKKGLTTILGIIIWSLTVMYAPSNVLLAVGFYLGLCFLIGGNNE